MRCALHTIELGSTGPRLVFLHGLFGQGRNWMTIGKALADSARVSLVDLPNHGRSPWTTTFSYSGTATAVAALLRTRYSAEPVVLIGHSMGGKVAMLTALEHPELVDSLAVVDVSPARYDSLSSFAGYVNAMRSLDLASLPDRAAADSGLRPYVPEPAIRGFLLQNLRRSPGAAGGWHWQMNLDLLADSLAEIGDWPEPAVTPYDGPVLWIAGSRSTYVRPEFAPAMRALFPRTQLVTVKDAGHWVHAERPQVVLAALRRFAGIADGSS